MVWHLYLHIAVFYIVNIKCMKLGIVLELLTKGPLGLFLWHLDLCYHV